MDSETFNKALRLIRQEGWFDIIYNYYLARIYSHIQVEFRAKVSAQDVAQSFFTMLFERKNEGYIEHPTAWVFACCDNIARSILAKQSKDVSLENKVVAAQVGRIPSVSKFQNGTLIDFYFTVENSLLSVFSV
jgi:DNA-directed RNA polymerase specialized sigma24 family protein